MSSPPSFDHFSPTPGAGCDVHSVMEEVTLTRSYRRLSFLKTRSPLSESDCIPLEVLRHLPKAELHCHLDGSVRVSTILELAREQEIDLPASTESELSDLICVKDECESLEEYLRGFEITLRVLQKQYALTRTFYEVCEDAVRDGVRYIEIRFSPILHTNEGLSLSQVMEAICEGRVLAESMLPITARIIVCGMRHMGSNVTKKMAEIAWRYRHRGVVAFDLAGPEFGFSSKQHKAAFDIVRRKLLNCTLHSGEGAGWESILDSIRYCGAQRLGHAVQLIANDELMHFVNDHRIAIEACPSSNLQTKAVSCIEEHPIRIFHELGICVVPCTDNVTVSNTTLSREYDLLQHHFSFSVCDIVRMIDNGFSAAFLDAPTKRRIRSDAMHDVFSILRAEGYDIDRILKELPGRYDAFWVEEEFNMKNGLPYWEGFTNPPITKEIVRLIPKADLNCRLDGSVSLEHTWQQVSALVPYERELLFDRIFGHTFSSFEEFRSALYTDAHCPKGEKEISQLRQYFNSLLQTEDQLRDAVRDILECAVDDHVIYLELCVRPRAHLRNGLSEKEALDAILDEISLLEEELPIKTRVIIYANFMDDDAVAVYRTAELAVESRSRGVVGFAIFKDEMPVNAVKYFESTFNFLRDHNMNIVLAAGKKDPNTVAEAVASGATRISGGFLLHEAPGILAFMADRDIPVEISPSDSLADSTADVRVFAGHPLRLYLDNDLRVTVCSFHLSLTPGRTDTYFRAVELCSLNAMDLLRLCGNGFRGSFLSYQEKIELFNEFWQRGASALSDRGFKNLKKKIYIPESPPAQRPADSFFPHPSRYSQSRALVSKLHSSNPNSLSDLANELSLESLPSFSSEDDFSKNPFSH